MTVDAVLPLGGRLRVLTKNETGEPITPPNYALIDASSDRVAGMFMGLATVNRLEGVEGTSYTSDPEGAVPMLFDRPLLPGRYRLEAREGEEVLVAREIDIGKGRTTEVVVVLPGRPR